MEKLNNFSSDINTHAWSLNNNAYKIFFAHLKQYCATTNKNEKNIQLFLQLSHKKPLFVYKHISKKHYFCVQYYTKLFSMYSL